MEENYEYEKKTILIVDDEQKIVDLLVHNLRREGYNTIEANDGQTAVDIALEKRPDLEKMQQAAAYLEGKHDYKSFCGNPRMKKSTVRVVDKIEITRKGSFIYFDFHGTGFLQNMVRILVGTLLEVGKGKIKPEQIPDILEAKNRQMAGPTAPPQGLCLIKVDY